MWRPVKALRVIGRVPGRIDTQEGHGLKAGLLRKLAHEVHQSGRVVKLAQVDVVSHSLPVGHDSHLETPPPPHTHTRVILHPFPRSSPPRRSAECVVGFGAADMTQYSI